METEFLVVKNRAFSKLAVALTNTGTTLTVTAGEGALFPSTYPFHLTIEDEIVSVTARVVDAMTIVREVQGTTKVAHSNLTMVALNITAKSVTDLNTAVNFIEKYADYALSFYGKITQIDDTTHFRVSGLAGMGTGWFKTTVGTPYEILVVQADGAAPEGQQTPVVAYTSTGGIFQHAAYSGGNPEVDDEVLIINPLLASLGTKATAAAEDAVTTDDYAMAYIKQLVTLLRLVTAAGPTNTQLDTAIKLITDDLDNATDGLHRLLAWIQYFGDKLDSDTHGLTAIQNTVTFYGLKLVDARIGLEAIIVNLGIMDGRLISDVFGLEAIKNTINAVGAYLSSGVFGLGVLKALIETVDTVVDGIQTNLGAVGDAATGDNLSDIASTSAHAKLRRLLLRFSSDAFSATVDGSARTTVEAMIQGLSDIFTSSGAAFTASIDGSARTDLAALYTALGVLLGTRDATVSAGVLADTESALALLKRAAQGSGLSILGDITGYTDVNNLVVADFIGWEDGYFIGWTAYLERDDGGSGAIPQGSRPVVTGYTSSSGALVLSNGLSAAGSEGDHLRLIHPVLMDAWNSRGGVGGTADVLENQAAELDVARGTSGAVTVDGGEDNLYDESADTEFILLELRVDLHNMEEGDTIIFRTCTTEDGVERQISDDDANTFTGPQTKARAEIIGSTNQVWGRERIRICAEKISGTSRDVTAYWRDAKRGS